MEYNKNLTIEERAEKLLSQCESKLHALNKIRKFKNTEWYDDQGRMLGYLIKGDNVTIDAIIDYLSIEPAAEEYNTEINIETCFNRQLLLIKNKEVKDLTKKALAKVNPKFYEVPASSTGKYHPKISLGRAGLVRHTKAVVYFATQLALISKIDQKAMDLVISACILHDTCKSGLHMEHAYTVHEHPILVKQLLSEDELTGKEYMLWSTINDLIASHMGQWNTNSRSSTVLPIPTSPLQKFVHTCDYLASRKELDFDVSVLR